MDVWSPEPLPLNHKFYKHFKGMSQVYLTGPDKFCLHKNSPQTLQTIKNFRAKEDDVYVISFPKAGTMWLREIVYLIMNNLDFQKAENTIRDQVFPFLEMNMMELPDESTFDRIEIVNNLQSPRLIKSHLPFCLLPPDAIEKKSKFLYIARNVKDTITSYFHFAQNMVSINFEGDIADLAELFFEGKIPYSPYIPHVKGFWERKHDPNVFFITYEELKKNQVSVILDVAKFLDRPITLEQAKAVARHCEFDKMKINKGANRNHLKKEGLLIDKEFNLMRKGIVGDWTNHMTSELATRIDQWIVEGTADSDVKYIM